MSGADANIQRTRLEEIIAFYRQLQIVLQLANNCFQTYLWPVYEFAGALIVIALIYMEVMFMECLHFAAQICVSIFMCATLCIICVTFKIASLPLQASAKILSKCNVINAPLKFSRQRRAISLLSFQIGTFHKIDQSRVPSLLRFVLQRTVFLIVQTRN